MSALSPEVERAVLAYVAARHAAEAADALLLGAVEALKHATAEESARRILAANAKTAQTAAARALEDVLNAIPPPPK